jgi:hypothetical protein
MARSKRDVKTQRTLQDVRHLRGLDRMAHFEAGGSLEDWRGRHQIYVDRRREANKRMCRRQASEE